MNYYIEKIYSEIAKYDSFVFYGAGRVERELAGVLFDEYGIIPDYCIVTNCNEVNYSAGIPVYSLNEKKEEILDDNKLIIVAVSLTYEGEIISLLSNDKSINFIVSSSYLGHPNDINSFVEIYKDISYDELRNKILGWYESIQSNRLFLSKIELLKNNSPVEIALVVENCSGRVIKLASALEKKGMKIFLFVHRNDRKRVLKSIYYDLEELSIPLVYYSGAEELFFYLNESKTKLIHIFSDMTNQYIPYLLIKFKEKNCPVVFENYDIANGYYINCDDSVLSIEKYLLTNADGVTYREYDLDYVENEMGINVSKNRLRILDGCRDNALSSICIGNDEGLSLCYVGGVNPDVNGFITPFAQTAAKCNENKVDFHLYPAIWDEEMLRGYIDLDDRYPYFHLHKPVKNESLIEVISKYDYGIFPIVDDIWDRKIHGYYYAQKSLDAAANKIFDYLDAGLPIIAATPQKMVRELERKGVLIDWTVGQYDFEYLKKKKEFYKKKVRKVREEYRISDEVEKLIVFYNGLISNHAK